MADGNGKKKQSPQDAMMERMIRVAVAGTLDEVIALVGKNDVANAAITVSGYRTLLLERLNAWKGRAK